MSRLRVNWAVGVGLEAELVDGDVMVVPQCSYPDGLADVTVKDADQHKVMRCSTRFLANHLHRAATR
jgi:hypothetical protein